MTPYKKKISVTPLLHTCYKKVFLSFVAVSNAFFLCASHIQAVEIKKSLGDQSSSSSSTIPHIDTAVLKLSETPIPDDKLMVQTSSKTIPDVASAIKAKPINTPDLSKKVTTVSLGALSSKPEKKEPNASVNHNPEVKEVTQITLP